MRMEIVVDNLVKVLNSVAGFRRWKAVFSPVKSASPAGFSLRASHIFSYNFMKAYIVVILFLSTLAASHGQTSAQDSKQLPTDTAYAVVERGANHRVWEKTSYELLPNGKVVSKKHRYTELAGGMHYKDANGKWAESKEEIVAMPQGGAAAVQGQHQVYFPDDIYQGVIETVTPDGKHLKSRPAGISYDDGTNTVMIAELKASFGYLAGSNQVIYPDAFTGVKADLVCTYRKTGFECDLVFREQPPMPEQYGLSSAVSRLQLVTEFIDVPEPDKTTGRTSKKDGLKDTVLRFGQVVMGQGKAFAVGNSEQDTNGIPAAKMPVYKTWLHLENRTFLIEEVPYEQIGPKLQKLPSGGAMLNNKTSSAGLCRVSSQRLLPTRRPVQAGTNAMQLAKVDFLNKSGVVLDYVILDSSSAELTNGTYLVTGNVYFDSVTFDSGVVVKYDPDSLGNILIGSGDSCCSSPSGYVAIYGSTVFTSKDDDSVGEIISGSTGDPSIIPTVAIVLATSDITISGCDTTASFHYLDCGIDIVTTDPVDFYSSYVNVLEFGNCDIGINQANGGTLNLSGASFANCQVCVNQNGSCVATVDNIAYNNCTYVTAAGYILAGGCSSYSYGGDINKFITSVANPFYPSGFMGCSSSTGYFYVDVCLDFFGSTPGGILFTWENDSESGSAYWGYNVAGGYYGTDMGSVPSTCPALLVVPDSAMGLYEGMMTNGGVTKFTIQYAGGGMAWNGLFGSESTDSNANGIPDMWELQYFGDLNHAATNDYSGDGLSNYQKYLKGYNPTNYNNVQLGYFRFDNTNTLAGSAGQLPLLKTNITSVSSWSTNAVLVDLTNTAVLKYRGVETNGGANILCKQGTVSLWIKPDWSSPMAGGAGPQNEGRMIEIGTKESTNGWWGLGVGAAGTNIYFGTQTNSASTLKTNLTTVVSWASNTWHQVVLTYSKTNSSLYLDGLPVVTNGFGVTNYPGLTIQAQGFTVGSSAGGTNQVRAILDELAIYNYTLTSGTISTNYQTAVKLDSDGDGLSNIIENQLGLNPYGYNSSNGLDSTNRLQVFTPLK